MKKKNEPSPRNIGIMLLVVLGVGLVIFGLHARGRLNLAQSELNSVPSIFTSNPIGGSMRRSAQNEINEYSQEAKSVFIIGAAVIAVGCAGFFIHKNHKS